MSNAFDFSDVESQPVDPALQEGLDKTAAAKRARLDPSRPVAESGQVMHQPFGYQFQTPEGQKRWRVPTPAELEALPSPAELAAGRTARSVTKKSFDEQVPTIKDEAGFAALAEGKTFIDPEGQRRVKPYVLTSDNEADFDRIPEGAKFLDPEGNERTKPTFEGIDFTAQTLYDMSVTPKEKRKALERSYPGKVQEDAKGLYIDDDGKLRRPGRGLTAAAGFGAAAAMPVGFSALGAIGLGAASGGVGAAVGGAGGGMLGQTFNDIILGLTGVYDRSITEQAAATGLAAAGGATGAGVGRGIAAVVPAAKAGVLSASQMLPAVAAKFLGAGSPETTMARELAEKGVQVPPSAWAHEAPHLQNVVEVFDPAFRTNRPLAESATRHYETQAAKILDDLGVKSAGSIAEPIAAVATKPAGEALLQKTLAEIAEADARLATSVRDLKQSLAEGLPATIAQREALKEASDASRKNAQKLIDQGFANIDTDADAAMKLAKAGVGTGELWDNIGNKLISLRQGVAQRAEKMYREADELAGVHKPDTTGLSEIARDFRDQLPGDFKSKYPNIVRQLDELSGVTNEAGEVVKEAVQPTFGQLHNLRSILRGNADWWTLSSDIKNGVYKFFSKRVDDALHDVNAGPELKAAAKALDNADAFYRENIRIFDAQQIKTIMRGLEAGEPADPANLYRAVVKEGQSDLTRRVRDMVGPNLWAGVRAADTKAMLDASKGLNPGEVDGRKFVREVLERHRANMLDVVHGKEASEKLLSQARAIEQLDGRLPIPVNADDTMTQVIARARLATDEAKASAKQDPLSTLTRETKKLDAERAREAARLKSERRNDPLGFLYDPTTGATEAVNTILGKEDLILAAAHKFGEKSPEFNMLRQIYAQRVLQGTLEPGKRLEKIAPEVQNLMFPGVTLKSMQTIAKEMDFLMDTKAAGNLGAGASMSAFSKVEHPIAGKMGSRIMKLVPGANPAARSVLGTYYKFVTDLLTSPSTLRWIEKGVTSGDPATVAATRDILRRHLQRGSAMGAGAGEAVEQHGIPE